MKKFIVCACCLTLAAFCAAQTTTELDSPEGKHCRVLSEGPLTPAETAAVTAALDTVWAIPGLEGTEASVRMEGANFRLVVLPTAFSYRGEDFLPRLPSGLSFYYRTSLFYDITMKVDGSMPKVTGAYIESEGLLKNIAAAVLMPSLFMYDDAILERVERLEAAVMATVQKGNPKAGLSSDLVTAVMSERNARPGATYGEIVAALKARGVKATVKDVKAICWVYFGM
jgi:hypothetical protein